MIRVDIPAVLDRCNERMTLCELYRQILGIQAPWVVADVEVDLKGDGATVHIEVSA